MSREVFVTGGTGYLGSALIPRLVRDGFCVTALVRPGSAARVPPGVAIVEGNALDASTFVDQIPVGCTFVQLVGVVHPSPSKARSFREIDLVSARESVRAAVSRKVEHFVYLSVAQPARMMKAYQEVRAEGESMVRNSGLNATFLRPWYVLGPGHRWPLFLKPFYWIAERVPTTRPSALRLGLVTLDQMVTALRAAVSHPPTGIRIIEVPEIRSAALES